MIMIFVVMAITLVVMAITNGCICRSWPFLRENWIKNTLSPPGIEPGLLAPGASAITTRLRRPMLNDGNFYRQKNNDERGRTTSSIPE